MSISTTPGHATFSRVNATDLKLFRVNAGVPVEDALEMVRQLFAAGVLQSAFWHQFTMTAHSPVGLAPEKFKVNALRPAEILFADNDVEHEDPTGADHAAYGYGLKKSLLNFMHGACLDFPLHKWFDFKVRKAKRKANRAIKRQRDFLI